MSDRAGSFTTSALVDLILSVVRYLINQITEILEGSAKNLEKIAVMAFSFGWCYKSGLKVLHSGAPLTHVGLKGSTTRTKGEPLVPISVLVPTWRSI
jgi:hypothetical protein